VLASRDLKGTRAQQLPRKVQNKRDPSDNDMITAIIDFILSCHVARIRIDICSLGELFASESLYAVAMYQWYETLATGYL
jgi:hypothetical protein